MKACCAENRVTPCFDVLRTTTGAGINRFDRNAMPFGVRCGTGQSDMQGTSARLD
jgi:hypothetical protein